MDNNAASSAPSPDVARRIQQATSCLPQSHILLPVAGEQFQCPADALLRLQNWAFTQGFAVVTESCRENRVIFQCIHHRQKTRNTRRIALENRVRLGTRTRAKGCTWTMYVSQRKTTGKLWILGWTHQGHSHDMNPNPFSYDQHKNKNPGYANAIERAITHRGIASYSASLNMLRKEGLPGLSKADFYNIGRKDGKNTGILTKHEEMCLIMKLFEDVSSQLNVVSISNYW
jgi:hypothetical protein